MIEHEESIQPFQFYTHLHLTELTGRKVHDLPELVEILKTAPGSVIYHHTHRFLKQHHYLSPEPPNDFAYWVTNVLQEEILGEQLASIDIIQFQTIRELREKLLAVVEDHLKKSRNLRTAPVGDELNMMKTRTYVFPTYWTAHDLESFLECLKNISINSIYFHMFEARLRIGKKSNDFSLWLENTLQETQLARAIANLDPYTQTLEGLRRRICFLVERRLHSKSEVMHVSAS
ncbi:MAG: DUF5752 family protein [bacterium]